MNKPKKKYIRDYKKTVVRMREQGKSYNDIRIKLMDYDMYVKETGLRTFWHRHCQDVILCK